MIFQNKTHLALKTLISILILIPTTAMMIPILIPRQFSPPENR